MPNEIPLYHATADDQRRAKAKLMRAIAATVAKLAASAGFLGDAEEIEMLIKVVNRPVGPPLAKGAVVARTPEPEVLPPDPPPLPPAVEAPRPRYRDRPLRPARGVPQEISPDRYEDDAGGLEALKAAVKR